MGFSLTISEGKERGREFTFSQPEVTIGRTAENDIVLTEPGISRRHVMVRQDGARFFVQDLGSANGTKINGSPVTDDEVHDGDEIQLGGVSFSFAAIAEAGGDSTRIFDPAELEKKMLATKKEKERAAAGAAGQRRALTAVAPMAKVSTASRRPGSAAGRPTSGVSESKALTKRPSSGIAPPPSVAPASARARARRQATTPLARVRLWWSEADKKVRIAAAGGGGLLLLLLVFGFVSLSRGREDGGLGVSDSSKSIFDLGPDPGTSVYGTGFPDITVPTADKAQFKFTFPITAKKATATLHFDGSGISKNEMVDIAVNTIHVGFMERTFTEHKSQDISIPPKYLHPNAENRLTFDNLKNPPGNEPWWLGRVWVEVQQLPEDRPENLKRKAQEQIVIGDRAWEHHMIGADGTYKAWKAYKQAKLYLEALDEKIDEYDVVKLKIKDCERKLDEICRAKMKDGVAETSLGHSDQAIAIFKGALLYFPEKDHHCYRELHEKLAELE